jgi:hypothetical protein
MLAEFGNDDVRHQALRSPRPRAIRIIVFIYLSGSDLPATCRLVADFSRTTCEHLEEHLLALTSGHTQEWDKDYQQHQSFAGVNEWRL